MKKLKSVLIVGSDGGIGSMLLQELSIEGFEFYGTTRRKNGLRTVRKKFLDLEQDIGKDLSLPFDFVIFTAGITSNEECLNDIKFAKKINVDQTIEYCNYFLERGSRVIFISSNSVFSGRKPFPLVQDSPEPKNFYGEMKLEVEEALRNHRLRDKVTILRITKVMSRKSRILERWLSEIENGIPITIYSNVFLAPTHENQILKACEEIIKTNLSGTFHLSSSIEISMINFALAEISKMGLRSDQIMYREILAPTTSFPNLDHNSLGESLFT